MSKKKKRVPQPVERRGRRLDVPIAVIEKRIVSVRGHRVMLDSDLAPLYGVTTFNLNKAMKRNRDRFPPDFMFQLTDAEAEDLRFQIGIPRQEGWGGRRYMPFAFTEQGVAMLSSVLRTPHAVQVNVAIMRAFVRLRELMVGNRDLAQRLDALERKYEGRFKKVFDAIRTLMTPPPPPHRTIGFTAGEQS